MTTKKWLMFLFVTLFLGCVGSSLCAQSAKTKNLLSFQGNATVLYSEGKVEISSTQSPGKTGKNLDWHQAREGTEVPPGSALRTGRDSKVILLVDERVSVKLGPDSQVTFRPKNGRGLRISIPVGEFWIQVQRFFRGGDPVELEAPEAIAAVKGTVFHGVVAKNGDMDCSVDEGELELRYETSRVKAGTGESCKFSDDKLEKSALKLTPFSLWCLKKGVEIENMKLAQAVFERFVPVFVLHKEEKFITIVPQPLLLELQRQHPEIRQNPQLARAMLESLARAVPLSLLIVVKEGEKVSPSALREGENGVLFVPARLLLVGDSQKNRDVARKVAASLIDHLSMKGLDGKIEKTRDGKVTISHGGEMVELDVRRDGKVLAAGSLQDISPANLKPGSNGLFLVKEGVVHVIILKPGS